MDDLLLTDATPVIMAATTIINANSSNSCTNNPRSTTSQNRTNNNCNSAATHNGTKAAATVEVTNKIGTDNKSLAINNNNNNNNNSNNNNNNNHIENNNNNIIIDKPILKDNSNSDATSTIKGVAGNEAVVVAALTVTTANGRRNLSRGSLSSSNNSQSSSNGPPDAVTVNGGGAATATEEDMQLLSLESTSTTTTATTTSALQNGTCSGTAAHSSSGGTLPKKSSSRLSSGRQQAKKAKRVRFYRNGDKFYPGIVLPVSNERYRSFESLTEDLTRLLGEIIKVPGAVRTIYTLDGAKKVTELDDLEDGKCYVCSCNNEVFKKCEYNSQSTKFNNRLSRVFRPSSPHKNGLNGVGGSASIMTSPSVNLSERDTVVFPRIVTLIRNGVKPRRIFRLLLNKRNSPSYEHVMTAITQRVHLDTGCVRKVFTLDGIPVLSLADFFQLDADVFFAYGNERLGNDDFELDGEEVRQIRQSHKTLKTGKAANGPKPKMPVKSHNDTFECVDENFLMIGLQNNDSLPAEIRSKYVIGKMIGDGNFAVVLKVTDRSTNKDYALKIIDKSKCLGKEHYIDAEIRIMKQLNHSRIISLISDQDTPRHMYLVMELVNGGDLFDAITRATRFSEHQSRVMIKHLASAMAYLHNMGIVHRDIKPENLLVELDESGNVVMLKLADFGLACEVNEPLLAVCGTPTYVAPEILMETGYGLKIDVWAAGIILYILLCGFPPFVSPDNQQEPLFDAILSGVYEFPEPYWNDIGDGVRDLIANMLQSDPDLRFSSEDILDHFWVLDAGDGHQHLQQQHHLL